MSFILPLIALALVIYGVYLTYEKFAMKEPIGVVGPLYTVEGLLVWVGASFTTVNIPVLMVVATIAILAYVIMANK